MCIPPVAEESPTPRGVALVPAGAEHAYAFWPSSRQSKRHRRPPRSMAATS